MNVAARCGAVRWTHCGDSCRDCDESAAAAAPVVGAVKDEFRERLATLDGDSQPACGTGDADVARYRNEPRRCCDDVINDHDFRSDAAARPPSWTSASPPRHLYRLAFSAKRSTCHLPESPE